MDKKRMYYKKKRYIIPLVLLIVIVLFRLISPIIVKKYVNKELANIEGYNGQIDHIDISIIKGAYIVEGLFLNKVDTETQIPFLDFPKIYFSLDFRSFLKGRLVSEIVFDNPKIVYIFEDHLDEQEKITEVVELGEELTDIVPLTINHFEIINGSISFVELTTDPDIDIHITELDLVAKNFGNRKSKKRKVPSTITATAISIGEGKLSLDAKLDTAKKPTDIEITFSLENADLTAFNDFSRQYAGVDFSRGSLSLHSEIAIENGYINGYLKPLIANSKLIGKGDQFDEILWEGFVGLFKDLLKNQRTNTLGMKIPIKGDLNKIKTKKFSSVISIFENAWIKAFTGKESSDKEDRKDKKKAKKSSK